MSAGTAKSIKIPDDIEYRVIGNLLCLMIASAGLAAGTMLNQRSFEYWFDDIVPLGIIVLMGFSLFRNLMKTMTLYQNDELVKVHGGSNQQVRGEQVAVAQIASKPKYTEEQVLEEVAKRIETKKAEAVKNSKFAN